MIENVTPAKVWDALRTDGAARLVDVRTPAEWAGIGLPDLVETGHEPALISWQVAPTMHVNTEFVAQMREAGLTEADHVYFLCRSGVRSMAAAEAARAAGFTHVYNVQDGFEGPPDARGQRGKVAGWQAAGLPEKHL